MTHTNPPITDADLISCLFSESPISEQTRTERAIDTDAHLKQTWQTLKAGLAVVEQDIDNQAPPPDFNQRLRETYEAEIHGERSHGFTSAAAGGRRLMRWSLPLAAAAAIALLLLTTLPTSGPNSAGVAWAQVTEAMQSTPQFRMTVFASDPDSMFEDLRLFHMDMYYRQPNGWRARGFGQVCFYANGTLSLYNAKTDEPIENTHTTLAGMTRDIAERKTDVLNAILNELFNDAPPPGEPVLSDVVTAQAGIDVFDYVGDPTQRRARVWVLRESKLPLRIQIYTAGTDDFMLVSFDYSDPKPEAFFKHGPHDDGKPTPR